MYSKKFLIGYTCIITGLTVLACSAMFFFFGYDFLLKEGIVVASDSDTVAEQSETQTHAAGTDTATTSEPQSQSVEEEPAEPEFEEEQQANSTADMNQESISIPGFEKWTVEAGQKTVTASFYNPEDNPCYFKLTVRLDDTGEVIYQSKYLKPGQRLYEVDLERPLSKGTYAATLTYETYSISDNSPMNGATIPFKLVAN